ncbi:MAG: endolytic transglycosylase MltG [Azospirillaceae bacterium]|nr:endolytic transglycosylase MltG [Azospirillaceae bacterium]
MRLRTGWLVLALVSAAVVAAGALAVDAVQGPGPATGEETVVIAKGAGSEAIARILTEHGVIRRPWLFLAAAKLTGIRSLQAGEFLFPAHASVIDAITLLRYGKPVVHRLTIPEGLTSAQIVGLVAAEPVLTGDIDRVPANGSLLPETYFFSFGDSREALIERMQTAMATVLTALWAQREADLPLTTPEAAVTLASIVEKETAIPAERPRIAGVFFNRLQQNIKLQSDPTIVFALTDGGGVLGRSLSKSDIHLESPYNTYVVSGLPPGPIANPGRASLLAVLHPDHHDLLYFVADGSGGHAFARTLEEHNKNVAHWHVIRQSQAPVPAVGPAVGPAAPPQVASPAVAPAPGPSATVR